MPQAWNSAFCGGLVLSINHRLKAGSVVRG
jgi:hypothetical protein